ncbi:MAG: hypothetical protein N2Z59_06345 [Alteraurantiacibacter sp.]|nr:hypothetical protein [Alteraurantiacibacter sp.]
MEVSRTTQAMARIEEAVRRIEVALEGTVLVEAEFVERHTVLRREAAAALTQIEDLLRQLAS